MKIFQQGILFLTLFALIFVACSEDEFVEVAVGPPSNLTLRFFIADDDSGMLTVFPEATNASFFDVFYGDVSGETPQRVQAGKAGTHTYPEGTFTMRVVATSLSGETVEMTQEINIQFRPPENFNVQVDIDPVNTNVITVTPTADNALLFETYFGDGDSTNIMAGSSATHTYDSSGQYILRVIARSASSTTLEFKDTLDIVKPLKKLTLPIDFEDPELSYVFNQFGNAQVGVIANPDPSGENTSANVARFFKPAGAPNWAGGFLQLPDPIDFNEGDQFSIKVWSPKAGAVVRFKVENQDNDQIFFEVDDTTNVINTWETLTFDLSTIDKGQDYHKVVVFMDFENMGDDSEYFFDDIIQIKAAVPLTLPIDFENPSVDYTFEQFGDAQVGVIANPDPSGENTSDNVARFFKPAGAPNWAGGFLQLPEPIDFSTADQFSIKVWSPKAGAVVRLKVENQDNDQVFFEADDTTTTTNTWETLTYDFSAIDKGQSYHKVVVFMDFENMGDDSEYYFDDITLGKPAEPLTLPIDFENPLVDYTFEQFGDAQVNVIANPDPSGENTSDNVARYLKPAGAPNWAGGFLQLPEPIDFDAGDQFSIKVWSPKSGAVVRLKIENKDNDQIFFEVDASTTTMNAWETLTYDFSAIDKGQTYQKVVVFMDFENMGDGSEYYFDDISQN